MRKKAVGLYTPYLDVMGGGEKHILSILKVFDDAGYEVVLFWNTDLSAEIQSRLKLQFQNLRFDKALSDMTFVEKARKLSHLEWLFYVTDGSYFFSPAKRTAIFCMVPDKKLYNLTPLNSLKTANARFVSNSHFTAHNLHKWGISSSVLYPYISDELFQEMTPEKKTHHPYRRKIFQTSALKETGSTHPDFFEIQTSSPGIFAYPCRWSQKGR